MPAAHALSIEMRGSSYVGFCSCGSWKSSRTRFEDEIYRAWDLHVLGAGQR